ncbi:HD domain-containing protein [Clostridium tertium]|uniref:HD domain-containing protein n=1 Tax=Clostridium tertium TaxID=1559 RepID=UPI0023B298D6|nr:HD domain-containing protein [Clostridium tertium]
MADIKETIGLYRKELIKKAPSIPQNELNVLFENVIGLCELYKDNIEELIEACDEGRVNTLDVPKGMALTEYIDELSDIILETILLSVKTPGVAQEQVNTIVNTDAPVVETSLTSLINGEVPKIEYANSMENDNGRKPPVVVQAPLHDSVIFEDNLVQYSQNDADITKLIYESMGQSEDIQNTEAEMQQELQEQQDILEKPTEKTAISSDNIPILDIKTLVEQNQIVVYAYCSACDIGESAKSRWLAVTLRDKDGSQIGGKLFGYKGDFKAFAGKVIKVSAKVDSFKGTQTLNISDITDENVPVATDAFIKSIPELNFYVKAAQDLINMIKNDQVKNMAYRIFQKENMLAHYANRASSVSYHGVLKGDLLKHCVNVVRSALYMIKINKLDANPDVIIVAGLLHDVGKIAELPPVGQSDYTMQGNLFGHTFIGADYVYTKCKEFNLPINITYNIVHCILAHHNKLEQGAVVPPMTLEAELISDADLMESQAIHYSENLEGIKVGEKKQDRQRRIMYKL